MAAWQMARSRCGPASMPFEAAFHPDALREWRTLGAGTQEQFKNREAGAQCWRSPGWGCSSLSPSVRLPPMPLALNRPKVG